MAGSPLLYSVMEGALNEVNGRRRSRHTAAEDGSHLSPCPQVNSPNQAMSLSTQYSRGSWETTM